MAGASCKTKVKRHRPRNEPAGSPHVFNDCFPYFFNTKLRLISLHFSKILLMEYNAKNISRTVITGRGQNFKKMTDSEFPYFFNTVCTFWPNSILFPGLENWFHNSLLAKPRGNPAYQDFSVENQVREKERSICFRSTDPKCGVRFLAFRTRKTITVGSLGWPSSTCAEPRTQKPPKHVVLHHIIPHSRTLSKSGRGLLVCDFELPFSGAILGPLTRAGVVMSRQVALFRCRTPLLRGFFTRRPAKHCPEWVSIFQLLSEMLRTESSTNSQHNFDVTRQNPPHLCREKHKYTRIYA